jgi:DNA gyrase/topoisomerase IV subunit B
MSNSKTSSSAENDALAKQYQRKTDKQHILDNPDTYIGSVENVDAEMWVYDEDTKKIALKHIEYIPGLYKLFDEGIVNCRDHVLRMIHSGNVEKKFVTFINTEISEDGTITLINDGNGIDIAKHPEHNLWIPEMIFGHLRTSTNYDKTEKKIVGGKNGFGFKLVLIWSTYGRIETVDHFRGLKYVQEFRNNLDVIGEPTITKCSGKPYTKVSFKPDYQRLGIGGLTPDMLSLLKKRVYDIAAVTDHSIKKVKISYNNTVMPVKNFQNYVDLYIGSKTAAKGTADDASVSSGSDGAKRVYEAPDERWEYAIALSPTHEFIQVSFVNGICTFKGGKHVEYITGQIVRKLCDYIEKKKKIKVNANSIKEQLILFLRCDIENPSFDSQTKDYMNTPSAKFGSSCSVSDSFIEKVAKMGVMDVACSLTEAKENRAAKKSTDGSKTKTIRGIANFIDANNSGTASSKDCILILCEGLSAMSGIVSGLSSEDRNTIGIYPLKGKLLNVRGEQLKKIAENKEITDIKKILGLESGREYKTIGDVHQYLRYGKIMVITDQDLDGSHIKGLCINLFHAEWASLVHIPGFISFMNTPILRAKKGAQTVVFYNQGEYDTWKSTFGPQGPHGWNIKYFKGLGTSTSAEFKEYFANKKIVDFVHNGKLSDDSIDKIFNKKRADDRKLWLENYDKTSYLDTSHKDVKYEDFINRELIHFSTYDCARSIPCMVDGLKISLRKILYSAFKRKLTSEIKVAQFSGYVSEHSSYHHGEASLNGAIVNMAQDFVGSNNINLLEPHGQFGCLSPDTPVLMWTGEIEIAKNINVGDILVGDDGNPRTVLKTTNGTDEMYEIVDVNNTTTVVNSQHILTLFYSKNGKIIWKDSCKSWYLYYFNGTTIKEKTISTTESSKNKTYNKSELSKSDAYDKIVFFRNELEKSISLHPIIDIKLTDYLNLSHTNKRHLFTVSNVNNINWDKKSVPIDPYILGAWLGDGDHAGNGFTTIDDEIVKSFALWADTINCEITHQPNSGRSDCYHYGIRRKNSGKVPSIGDVNNSCSTCPGCKDSRKLHPSCNWVFEKCEETINCGIASNGMKRTDLNPFKEILKKHNLYKNKHIPFEYMINDRETRLQLLAGFIDTDGCIKQKDSSPSIEIGQSERLHGNLIDSLNFIAKSLGLSTSVSYTQCDKTTTSGLSRKMKVLRIFGDNLHDIPMRIPRKIINIKKTTNMNYSKFVVNPIGKGEFYGWQIDRNERFLLGNFIVTHNSRLQGGDDSASERYIFTQLNSLTRAIFPDMDDAVLNYLDDDGTIVEPEFYAPIIPFALVNGISGIGTGFSCSIPAYNPQTIVGYLKNKLRGLSNDGVSFVPYYEGFKGSVCAIDAQKYLIKGCYEKIGEDKVRITELPVGTWTMPYISMLEGLMDGGVDKAGKKIAPTIKDMINMSTEVIVDITVVLPKGKLVELKSESNNGINGVEKMLKLTTTVSTTNMHLFNHESKLHKYATVEEIIEDFYKVRMSVYEKRKAQQIKDMENKLVKLSNRARYIKENLDGVVDLRRKSAIEVNTLMETRKFDKIDGDYKYLIKMPMDSVTLENAQHIMQERDVCEKELATLRGTSLETIWLSELDNLEREYTSYRNRRGQIQAGTQKTIKKAGGGKTSKK